MFIATILMTSPKYIHLPVFGRGYAETISDYPQQAQGDFQK